MTFLHIISIAIEAIISLFALTMAIKQKKSYGWGIFITFGIYVFYDLAKYLSFTISSDLLYLSFFLASLSALWAVWTLFKIKRQ